MATARSGRKSDSVPPAEDETLRLETLAVGHGYDPAQAWGAIKPPLVPTSTFVYPSAEAAKEFHRAYFAGEAAPGADFIYARLGHPNLSMVEARMAALDRAPACAGFNSGMAAASTLALAFLRPGDSLVHSRPIYSGVEALAHKVLPDFGIAAEAVSAACDGAALRAAVAAAEKRGPLSLIMLETPANPTAALADIALAREVAEEVGARQGKRPLISVDNTFLGPLLQTPLAHGADLTLTSLTKYCGGHSDLLAGSVSGPGALITRLKSLRTVLGNHMEPFTAWLLLRSLESLAPRQERACANAAAVAHFLRSHPKVAAVSWLGFVAEGSAEQAVYARQCGGAGSTFSFAIKGGEAEAFRLLNALKVLKLAVSLGGSETLICHPATTTHYEVPQGDRAAGGITDGTLRLSVGLEHPDDLIADLARGLEAV